MSRSDRGQSSRVWLLLILILIGLLAFALLIGAFSTPDPGFILPA